MSFVIKKLNFSKLNSLALDRMVLSGRPCVTTCPVLLKCSTLPSFNSLPQELQVLCKKFEQECRLLSAVKHPHIVQYLGTYHDPGSKLPVLLMELMDASLTRFLERSHEPLPYHTEVNLCHDIALALSYLHSNGIVHHDLSSNNVLLIAVSRAKVTDFGMVKLYDVNRSTAHLTPLHSVPRYNGVHVSRSTERSTSLH